MFGLEIVGIVFVVGLIGTLGSKRGRRLIFGAGSLAMSNVEQQNPQIMMQAAKDDFRKKMAAYNTAQAQVGGVAERLKASVLSKSQKLADLDARIQANIDAGNTALAAQLAGQHDSLEADLNHDKESLKQQEAVYQTSLQQVKITQQEFQKKIDALQNKMSQTQIAEAQAEAGAALQGVSFSAADIGDTMKSLEDGLDKRYEKAAGKARLVTDLADNTDLQAKEGEQKALDQAALARFMAKKNGGVVNTAAPAQATEKQMGPAAVSA